MRQKRVYRSGIFTIEIIEGETVALLYGGEDLLSGPSPVWRARLVSPDGVFTEISSREAADVTFERERIIYGGLPLDVTAAVSIREEGGKLFFGAEIENRTDNAVEWIMLLPLRLLPLWDDGGIPGTELLIPYNEGAVLRSSKGITGLLPEYPSYGHYMMFPNMIFAQFVSYLFERGGEKSYLSLTAHDGARAPKEITLRDGEVYIKTFCGGELGGDSGTGHEIALSAGTGGWESAASEYRRVMESYLPPSASKIRGNARLPEWYGDNVLVVSYPVRGAHDMDRMDPNAFYPYRNALPILREIAVKTGMRPLALLMHWEGTAPWAPPYVWPPYGGEETFFEFRDALHEENMLLGVYCSGLGFTRRSNLVEGYDLSERIENEGLLDAMCAGPDGEVKASRICPGQRSGHDICPACSKGKEILDGAYGPLFGSGVDYAQILDQNHGGGQYLCYSRRHGHAPVPGKWMTESMQRMLSGWNQKAGKMILGCESAAAEPFIGELLLSDDRYELCFCLGRPVPLYSFIFHEYLRNFMGNQVSSPLPHTTDGLTYRIAYSFAAGDIPTIVLTPDGGISPSWSTKDFSEMPDREEVLSFLRVLSEAFEGGLKPFLTSGKMIESPRLECREAPFGEHLPAAILSSWQYEDRIVHLLIDPFKEPVSVKLGGEELTVNGRSALVLP